MRHHVSTSVSAQVDPAELTTTFTNDGRVPATSVRTSVAMPDECTATAVSSPTNNNVGYGRSFTTTWSVTAPKGVDPGSYPISATTSYLWDDGTRNGSASGSTTSSSSRPCRSAAPSSVTTPGRVPATAGDRSSATRARRSLRRPPIVFIQPQEACAKQVRRLGEGGAPARQISLDHVAEGQGGRPPCPSDYSRSPEGRVLLTSQPCTCR